MVYDNTNNGRLEVYLNTSIPAVTNSCFYSNSFWDAFFGYEHNDGSAWRGSDTIYFTANGTHDTKTKRLNSFNESSPNSKNATKRRSARRDAFTKRSD